MLIFETEIKGITDNSRNVKKDFLFVAIKGLTVDGHDYIPKAIASGAKVIVGTKDLKLNGVKYVKVKDSRKELGILASKWYGDPSKKLKIIGVTGTDGKTTTSNLIYWILKTAGKKVGLISTINAKISGGTSTKRSSVREEVFDTGLHVTNPEPLLLQELLNRMVKEKCEYAVLEITSHGLDQERVAGIKFDTAVLTNITHEHIDYHKTFKKYVETKGKLFKNINNAVINANNNSPDLILPYVNKKAKVFLYLYEKLDQKIEDTVNKRFPENYNKENATAAIATCRIYGVAKNEVISAIKSFPSLSGRMEEIKNKKGIKIFVDFAHTPNALKRVLTVLKKPGKLIVVFGCAGERDIQKRKMMPKISVKLADISIFTAEDPRSENVEDILKVMADTAKENNGKENINFYVLPERGEAISFAINKLAQRGDTVVICGKGHEKSMAYNGVEYPWSDQKAAKLALDGKIMKIKWK